MTTFIAECSFDYSGKTYEYSVEGMQLHECFGEFDLANYAQGFNDLYAVTCKTDPFPEHPSPKEFSLVRVHRVKPFDQKEFPGDLKKVHHLFLR